MQTQSEESSLKANALPPKPQASTNELPRAFWNIANLTVVAGVTSATLIGIQSPIRTLIINFTKYNTFLPSYTGGTLSLFRVLYAGTNASLSGSAVRTAYFTTAKDNKQIEENEERIKQEYRVKYSYVASAAMGDILVTQIPESLSILRKIPGLLPPQFKWYTPGNASRLMFCGFISRYFAGLVSFYSMLRFEEQIAKQLAIKNETSKHFLAGTISGATAAFIAYPFTSYKDYHIALTKVTPDGQIITQNSSILLKNLCSELINKPKVTMQTALINAKKQLPIRMGLSGLVFSIISGIGEALGTEPLAKIIPDEYRSSIVSHRFFTENKTPPEQATEESTPAPAPQNTPSCS